MRYLALVATISSGLGACAPGDTPRDAPPEGVPAAVSASSDLRAFHMHESCN